MTAPGDEESFRRLLEEMSGGSRDYGIRKTLDQRVRAYFQSLDIGRPDEIASWYANNVIRITNTQVPGGIFKGTAEVLASHQNDYSNQRRGGWSAITVPSWVIVDRGRITCRIERFFYKDICKEVRKYTSVLVFDLDSTGHVKRVEYRRIKYSIEDGPVEELIEEAKAKQEDMQTSLEA
ncbi:hypothetical protein COL154_004403 [Colletotrichum chrysophilum]|uniref:Uncharacterized protein n=1 Tax=Colletotrichum chrysophilum TaxID=1836956 RepID=A0AAD9AYW9_9PEZI|nr:uncharacterized protein COL26b_009991 [Colletotrichum chrysophilum]KAJ0344653.1 hypothetical protein KNSL1_009150 [Colletotrichum chrysophilum]KAJ0365546.1 hypothetical protein COL154_004403 [Colletotrichum chrysophilum]KAJ0370525.1 hypothetical protein COL26b_009991 [Colletotrichum chrysophilum]KAK1855235.1 hypothetical protein CCHR01_02137 [Colletotrichum chrysophilum]